MKPSTASRTATVVAAAGAGADDAPVTVLASGGAGGITN